MRNVPAWLDETLYPDEEPPDSFEAVAEQVDFLVRLCGAWDFGILPEQATIQEVRQAHWRTAVDECQLLTSPTYHLQREWHDLPELPYLGAYSPHILNDPNLAYV